MTDKQKELRQFLTDISNVANFLYGAAQANEIHRNITADDALTSFCRVIDVDEATLKLKFGGFIR